MQGDCYTRPLHAHNYYIANSILHHWYDIPDQMVSTYVTAGIQVAEHVTIVQQPVQ